MNCGERGSHSNSGLIDWLHSAPSTQSLFRVLLIIIDKEMSKTPKKRKKIVLGVKSFLILLFIGKTKLITPMLQLY